MNKALFVYDFPHKKSQEFLIKLWLENLEPEVVIAAPYKELSEKEMNVSEIRVKPNHKNIVHPKKVAKKMDIPYYVSEHNSEKTRKLLNEYKIDLGIIGGARILKDEIIKSCDYGILNFHPGILPDNRGLDALKWAILKDIPPGVTAHLINRKVDSGKIVMTKKITIKEDDTFVDLSLRLFETQLEILPVAINKVKNKDSFIEIDINQGFYHSKFPKEKDELLLKKFKELKEINI